MKKGELYSDMHFDGECPTHEEIKALAEATATMISDKNNKIITVMPGKKWESCLYYKITRRNRDDN